MANEIANCAILPLIEDDGLNPTKAFNNELYLGRQVGGSVRLYYKNESGVATVLNSGDLYATVTDFNNHINAADPHPQYITSTELTTALNDYETVLDYNNTTFGVGQLAVDVTASREKGVTYYNTTNKPILIVITSTTVYSLGSVTGYINGVVHSTFFSNDTPGGSAYTVTLFVLPTDSYKFETLNHTISKWVEVR